MINVRKSAQRGYVDYGWLKSSHTFSFGNYYDPSFIRFRTLRVINEDKVAPGKGFGSHPHDNMEIVTYVLSGSLEHEDSLGNRKLIRAGEIQRMSAGTGVTHSEYNPSSTDPVHFYQIWILPDRKGIEPSYEQRGFNPLDRANRFQPVASKSGMGDSITINQEAAIYLADIKAGVTLEHELANSQYAWLQVLRGDLTLNGESLLTGDGAAIGHESLLKLSCKENSELMLFELS
jgi:redox-sensitive bicupin YhaK (pirin superfamily)